MQLLSILTYRDLRVSYLSFDTISLSDVDKNFLFTADIRLRRRSLAPYLRNARRQRAAYKKHFMIGCMGGFGFIKHR